MGFVLTGKLSAPASQSGKTTEITACLNTDTGPNTSGSFAADVGAEVGGNNTIQIQTATLDGTTELARIRLEPKAAFASGPSDRAEEGRGFGPVPLSISTLTPLVSGLPPCARMHP